MFLDFLLSPFTSRDNIVGGTLGNMSDIKASRRHSASIHAALESSDRRKALALKEREVAALEKLADKHEVED